MREIKFRVWDVQYGYMNYSDMYCEDSTLECYINLNGKIRESGYGIERNDIFKLMQYTGLKDKNGVEIYDGDIVNLFPEYDDMSTAYEIKYDGCSFKIDCGLTPYNTNLEEICKKIKVIGNIYENPLQSN